MRTTKLSKNKNIQVYYTGREDLMQAVILLANNNNISVSKQILNMLEQVVKK